MSISTCVGNTPTVRHRGALTTPKRSTFNTM